MTTSSTLTDYRSTDRFIRATENGNWGAVDVMNLEDDFSGSEEVDSGGGRDDRVVEDVAVPRIIKLGAGLFYLPGYAGPALSDHLWNKAISDWPWLAAHNTNIGEVSDTRLSPKLFSEKPRLRWISLGVGYDWTARTYETYTEAPGDLPSELKNLAKDIVRDLQIYCSCEHTNDPHNKLQSETELSVCHCQWRGFRPDCALVNYYRGQDRLRGHSDNVEASMSMPLITISLGKAGVFLLGGPDLSTKPRGIILRSGDILVMGCQARVSYHGIPRLLYPNTLPDPEPRGGGHDMRINISIRQCW